MRVYTHSYIYLKLFLYKLAKCGSDSRTDGSIQTYRYVNGMYFFVKTINFIFGFFPQLCYKIDSCEICNLFICFSLILLFFELALLCKRINKRLIYFI